MMLWCYVVYCCQLDVRSIRRFQFGVICCQLVTSYRMQATHLARGSGSKHNFYWNSDPHIFGRTQAPADKHLSSLYLPCWWAREHYAGQISTLVSVPVSSSSSTWETQNIAGGDSAWIAKVVVTGKASGRWLHTLLLWTIFGVKRFVFGGWLWLCP